MGKSYRHKPIIGNTCAKSEKKDKDMCNKKLRRRAKLLLAKYGEEFIEPLADEVFNEYLMSKDGKQYFDIKEHQELMRK